MNEFELKIEELLERKLRAYGMSLKQFSELDVDTKNQYISKMYFLKDNLRNRHKEKTKVIKK